jgi:hypothetical protein
MASCGEIQGLLGPFDDGELRPRQMEEVAFHVVGCSECRTALDEYRSLGVALRAVTALPPLDGLAHAVMARIQTRRVPLGLRLREFWTSLGRWGSAIQIVAVGSASAMLTLVLLGPHVKDSFRRSLEPVVPAQLAQNPARSMLTQSSPGPSQAFPVTLASVAADPSGKTDEAEAAAVRDSQELVSALGGGSGPSMAVWNEPRTRTTVVWVPDQQP